MTYHLGPDYYDSPPNFSTDTCGQIRSKTPVVDASRFQYPDGTFSCVIDIDVAKKLERALNEAREENRTLREMLSLVMEIPHMSDAQLNDLVNLLKATRVTSDE